jgi:hypothetical protein
MIRKLEVLGVAVLAILAVSAVAASAAHATNFTASSYPATVTATSPLGNDDIKTEAGSVECKAHYQGTLTGASETLKLVPSYSECRAFGFLSATASTNGCFFIIHTNGEIDIHCETVSGSFVFIASTCRMHISAQTSLETIKLTNGVNDINLQFTASGISYNVTTDDFGCPFNGTGAKSDATYTENNAITLQGVSGVIIIIQ